MVSILTVPTQRAGTSDSVELRPDHTRQWLAKLPLRDSEESLNSIFEALYELNRVAARAGARLRLLELYRTPIVFIAGNVERMLSGHYIPLSEKHARLADLCKLVTIEMAYGYKTVVLDVAKTLRSPKPGEDLCTAIHRSIRYLGLSIFQCAIYYSSHPPGTWSELHSLYGYARKLGICDSPVKDALNRSKPKNSIAHVYHQALLFGLSDNNRNTVSTIGKIHRYLDRWASAVEVLPYAKPPTTRCQFIVDPEQDHPGKPYSGNIPTRKTRHLLLLDTRGITKTAHDQWQKLRAGASPKSVGLGDDFFDDSGYDMLERAVLAWGIAPRRKYPRNDVAGAYQMVVGIEPSHYFFNGERRFTCASEEGTDQQVLVAGTFGMQQLKTREGDRVLQDWQINNESIHGACLHADIGRPQMVQVRVGEIAAFRPNRGDARWSAGVIRWARVSDNELRVGLQKLGTDASAVAVKPVKPKNDSEESFKNSIVLPEFETVKQQRSLVTPPRIFGAQRNLLVDDGEVVTMARAGKLLERNSYFDWFTYEVLNI